jgi:hypothetical protein
MTDVDTRWVQNLSLPIGCMKPSLKSKLRTMEESIASNASMKRYGPVTEEVKVSETPHSNTT